jgi:hypothetical protein
MMDSLPDGTEEPEDILVEALRRDETMAHEKL